jgi:hypothetical protein
MDDSKQPQEGKTYQVGTPDRPLFVSLTIADDESIHMKAKDEERKETFVGSFTSSNVSSLGLRLTLDHVSKLIVTALEGKHPDIELHVGYIDTKDDHSDVEVAPGAGTETSTGDSSPPQTSPTTPQAPPVCFCLDNAVSFVSLFTWFVQPSCLTRCYHLCYMFV